MSCLRGFIGLFCGFLPNLLQLVHRKLIMLGSRLLVPFDGLADVLCHAKAILIAFGEVVLCLGISLFGRNRVPTHALS